MEKLEVWYSSISSYEQIDFTKAKELFLDIQNESNLQKRKEKRDRLITGTLYNIYKFIIKNNLHGLNSSTYDMDDIISICSEVWISMIDNGKLLIVDSFSKIFDYKFYSELTDKLIPNKYSIGANTIIDINTFVELLYEFIIRKNKNNDFDYNKFFHMLKESSKYEWILYKFRYHDSYFISTYELFNSIYESLDSNSKDNLTMSKTKLEHLKYILISNGIEQLMENINNVFVEDFTTNLVNTLYQQEIIDYIFEGNILNETEKHVLKRLFGIRDTEQYTIKEIAKEIGKSKVRVRQIEAKALRKLRCLKIYKKPCEN